MALELQTNKAPAKITFNTSKIAQGFAINLSKVNPNLKRVAVKIKWIGDDLDISAVGIGKDGAAVIRPLEVTFKGKPHTVPQDLIFYMNLEQAGVKHGGDIESSGEEEEEQILVSAADLHGPIAALDFIVTSHVEKGAALLFKDVTEMSAELIDLDTNEVIYQTDLDCSGIANQSAATFATLSQENGEWSYTTKMLGLGKEAHGVQNVLSHYYS